MGSENLSLWQKLNSLVWPADMSISNLREHRVSVVSRTEVEGGVCPMLGGVCPGGDRACPGQFSGKSGGEIHSLCCPAKIPQAHPEKTAG